MKPTARGVRSSQAGFTLIEVLVATLLMTVILAALATVTAQWLPNWNRGMARVQRAERLALALDRILADLSVAEMIPLNGDAKVPVFEGSELAVTFVRTPVGPNAHPGFEFVRLIEKADAQGPALVRERAPFAPMPSDAQIRFADQVVLLRLPFRVTFSYAGRDQVWAAELARPAGASGYVRIAVRDGATGQLLSVSSAALVHINASAECARAKDVATCVTNGPPPKSNPDPDAQKKEPQL